MTDQDAEANLFFNVFQRGFFDKLASYGIYPQTQEEAALLLDNGHRLRALEEQGLAKRASSQTDFLKFANQSLAEYMDHQDGSRANTLQEEQNLKLASALAEDPTILEATATYIRALQGGNS